jgi:predicted lipid carrier protein YhbT
MIDSRDIPRLPQIFACGVKLAPLTPLRFACDRLIANLARRRPHMFERLGEHATKTVTIDPTDLPLVFRLSPDPRRPRLEALRAAGVSDARIAGPLAALIGLVHGAYDGDALFFSRDLVIEGDTGLVVALRNAIDNEEIDLAAEAGFLLGPLAAWVAKPLNRATRLAERLTGVALSRRAAAGEFS